MFSNRSPLLLLIISVILVQSALGAGKFRRWTDSQGRKIEAKMTGFANGRVILEMKDGRVTHFPIEKLRQRDQDYARENMPIDLASASTHIDKMLWEGLKNANTDIKRQKAELLADKEIDPTERNKEMARLVHMEKMTHPTPNLSDAAFMRRVYLDIGGRIPTHDEASRFLRKSSSNKRNELIDQLIESEAFVSHFFNYLGDLLRIRDGISMGGFDNLKSGAYVDWVKDQIRKDRPWDKFVSDLLSAEGYLWENPATGYLLTDYGMELCNLSNTFTTFAGTEITCAQCHNHPFEDVYQIDFYRMAAFFGNVDYKASVNNNIIKAINSKKREFGAAAKKAEENLNDLNTFFSAYQLSVGDGPKSKVELPFDYQYDNGEPYEKVRPGVYFGDIVDVAKNDGPRFAFAEWMTTSTNPRFTINIVNRLWKHVFGIAQIEPVDNIPGHLDGQAQNYELLKYLERLMVELDYDVKDFLKVLYKTRTYQREACYTSPTLTMIDRGEFHFPAPILRRMSAEQLWDSLVAMSVKEPEAPELQTRILEGYREIMNANWGGMTYADAKAMKARYDRLGRPAMMGNNRNRNRAPARMIRASEMSLPNNVGSFLFSFGQSDKKFIENGSRDGTIPQVMELLNGSLTNKVMAGDSKRMVAAAKEKSSRSDGSDIIFLSILSRNPKSEERDYVKTLVRGGEIKKGEKKPSGVDYSDLIWALLNTREFMFIQ